MQEDDCKYSTHGCWTSGSGDKGVTACKDTFRGYVCQCPPGSKLFTFQSRMPGHPEDELIFIKVAPDRRADMPRQAWRRHGAVTDILCFETGHEQN